MTARIPEEEWGFTAIYKIAALGEPKTGKTELLDAIATGRFERHPRLGIHIVIYDVKVDTDLLKLIVSILDGNEVFHDLRTLFCRGAKGGLLFIDCTRPSTAETVPQWINSFRKAVGPKPPLYLVGMKPDLKNRKVTVDAAEHLVKQHNLAGYYEIPTDQPDILNEILHTLAAQMYNLDLLENTQKSRKRKRQRRSKTS
ncbi:MAG: hypothetical protein ACFFBU_07140 [Promethearchaeota archaeon]